MRWLKTAPDKGEALAVCLGYFDGVHIGHQKLIGTAKEIAEREGISVCVHTYDTSPVSVLFPERKNPILTELPEKERLLIDAGADYIALSHFDGEFMQMSGEEFIDRELRGNMLVKYIVIGFDHRFGYKGKTDAAKLQLICDDRGIDLVVVPEVYTKQGEAVSSTVIKKALYKGDIPLVERMLGRKAPVDLVDKFKNCQF